MWPIILTFLRSNAVYITLPFAVIIGAVGYNLENILSDKYTPYSSKYRTVLWDPFRLSIRNFFLLEIENTTNIGKTKSFTSIQAMADFGTFVLDCLIKNIQSLSVIFLQKIFRKRPLWQNFSSLFHFIVNKN